MGTNTLVVPHTESFDSVGGPGFETKIVKVDSGREERTIRWNDAARTYDLRFKIRSRKTIYDLYSWFMAHKGAGHAFMFKDWNDYASTDDGRVISDGGAADTTHTDEMIGIGDGSQQNFQLQKTYTHGLFSTARAISRPVPLTTTIALDGVLQSSGWTVDTVTGIVNFTTAPGIGVVVTAGYQFYVPVRISLQADKQLDIRSVAFDADALDSFPLVEVKEAGPANDMFFFGGSFNWDVLGSMTANIVTNLSFGTLQIFNPTVASLNILLPDPVNATPAAGWPFLMVENASTTQTLGVTDHLGTPITGNNIIPTQSFGELGVGKTGGGARTWRMAL